MPRANRYFVPGYVYHLTHRCHNRQFLLRFARDRDDYRLRLRQAVGRYDLSVLDYCLTSNHVHLLAFAEDLNQISEFMQKVAGEFGQAYNRRKARTGAYWGDRFHSTMVEPGENLSGRNPLRWGHKPLLNKSRGKSKGGKFWKSKAPAMRGF
jgi:putative transposase